MLPSLSNGRNASPDPSQTLMTKRTRTSSNGVSYDSIRAIIITFEDHDFDASEFEAEIKDVVDLFQDHLGVSKCVQLRIPADCTGHSVKGFLQRELLNFQREPEGHGGAGEKHILELVYVAGHGQVADFCQRKVLHVSSGKGQSFDWNFMQWSYILGGVLQDALVLLDCCHAGTGIECLFQGCENVFAACSAEGTTAAPGKDSFSNLFVLAAKSITKPFSIEDWADKATLLARARGCQEPVLTSIGNASYQMCLNQEYPTLQAQVVSPATMRRERLIEVFVQLQANLSRLDPDSKFSLSTYEFEAILSDASITEPFNQIEIHRAVRKIRDRILEIRLLSLGCEDPDDHSNPLKGVMPNASDRPNFEAAPYPGSFAVLSKHEKTHRG